MGRDAGLNFVPVNGFVRKTADLPKPNKTAADHAMNFEPPIYTIILQTLPNLVAKR